MRSPDLNRSTNRPRRKGDPTDKWIETRPEVDRVLDDARRINQAVAITVRRQRVTVVSCWQTSMTWRVAMV